MGKMTTEHGLSSKTQDLKATLAHRRDFFDPVFDKNQWGNTKPTLGSTTESKKVSHHAVNGTNEQGHYQAQFSPTEMKTRRHAWPGHLFNLPDIAKILPADCTPEFESDIPIDLPLWGYFSKAMDQSVLDVEDAIKAGYYSPPSWTREEKLFRVDKLPKLDNRISGSNESGSDEIRWAQPTEEDSGLELDGAGPTIDKITEFRYSDAQSRTEITSDRTSSKDGDPFVPWTFSHLAKDAKFSFVPVQTPESYEEIPTWSNSMYHSSVFPDATSNNSWDDFTFNNLGRSLAADIFSTEAVVDKATGIIRSSARRPSRLSEQINLEEWKLFHILNDRGFRPRSGSDLATRFRPRTKSVWDDKNRQWNVVPRSPSPPAQRPTAWQTVPAWSYVYRVAGLRFPKVFADQVELSEDRKNIIRNGRQAAKEAKEVREQMRKDEQRRTAREKAKEERKKEILECEMKVLDGYLWSLRYLFREEEDEKAKDDDEWEAEEEDAGAWGGGSDGKVCDEKWGDDWAGWGLGEEGKKNPWIADSRDLDKFEEPSGKNPDWGDSTPKEESAWGKEKAKKRSHLFTLFSDDFIRNVIREQVKKAEKKEMGGSDTLTCGKRKRVDA